MRAVDRKDGSLRALLILVLLFANLAVAITRHPERRGVPSKDPVEVSNRVKSFDAPPALLQTPRFTISQRRPSTSPSASLGMTELR